MATTPVTNPVTLTIAQRLASPFDQFKMAIGQNNFKLRCALPGIIQSFNAEKMTATVLLAVTEANIVSQGDATTTSDVPLLSDVPVMFPRAGGFSITFPVTEGDECLLVFADQDIQSWWQNGGDNNVPIAIRRHSIEDPIAIVGLSSQHNLIRDVSTYSLQIRSDDGETVIDVADGTITINAASIILGDGGSEAAVMLAGFLTWFQSTYMPAVQYVTTAPAVPSTGLKSTIVKGQ